MRLNIKVECELAARKDFAEILQGSTRTQLILQPPTVARQVFTYVLVHIVRKLI